MHTVDHETPGPISPMRRPRFLQSEDTALATLGAWTIGLAVFTLGGFYFGSIAGHENHPHGAAHKDLDPQQLAQALPFAAAGLLIGLLFALFVTFYIVPLKLRELEHEQGHH